MSCSQDRRDPASLSPHVRCTLCGLILPYGWLRLPNHPNSAMLLHHLGAKHPGTCRPYLVRMERACIDMVLMEVFEHVADAM